MHRRRRRHRRLLAEGCLDLSRVQKFEFDRKIHIPGDDDTHRGEMETLEIPPAECMFDTSAGIIFALVLHFTIHWMLMFYELPLHMARVFGVRSEVLHSYLNYLNLTADCSGSSWSTRAQGKRTH